MVPRTLLVSIGVDETKQKLPFCNFDKCNCSAGITALERYENQYDDKKAMYVGHLNNWASNPSEAFRLLVQAY